MEKKMKMIGAALLLIFGLSTVVYAECSYEGGFYPDGYILPHTVNQAKYFVCFDGLWLERECPWGLLYNPATQMCDYPWNVPPLPGGE
jgi:hypothetical protein